jgi:16S rRNA processing protein RimM
MIDSMGRKNDILIARIGAPHGIRGEVRMQVFAEDVSAVTGYGPLHDTAGRPFKVLKARPAKSAVIATLDGVTDRNGAEALSGTELFVARSALPEEALGEDELYWSDLEGLEVFDQTGRRRGSVIAIHDFGAGTILEIKPGEGASVMIPFSEAAVPDIDIEAGRLTVEPVAAGLDEAGEE